VIARNGATIGGRQCGFPVRMLKSFKQQALHLRLPYVVIGENGYCASGLKRRVVTEKMTFVGEIGIFCQQSTISGGIL
jgi:hypothetical protein